MKSLLIVSKGIFHPPFNARLQLDSLVKGLGRYETVRLQSFEKLADTDLSVYSGIILYYHLKENSKTAAAIANLSEYVRNGGGVLGMHGSTASFKSDTEYSMILGSRFTGHGKVSSFDITGFRNYTVTDELYTHQLENDCQVILRSGNEPVYWKRASGKGRVAVFTPGHRKQVFTLPETRDVIEDALKYVCGGDLI